MGVSVEQCKGGNQRHGDGDWRPHRNERQQPEHDDRGGDDRLDERQADIAHRCGEAHDHHHDEGRRHRPDRASAEQARPEADTDHGEDMIEAEERMGKPGRERAMFDRIEMGESGCGCDQGKTERDPESG